MATLALLVRDIGDAVRYLLPKQYVEKFPGESYEPRDLGRDKVQLLLRLPEQKSGSLILAEKHHYGHSFSVRFWMVGEPVVAEGFSVAKLEPLTNALFNGIRIKHRGTSVETYFKRPDDTNARIYAYTSSYPVDTDDLDKAYQASVEFMQTLHGRDFKRIMSSHRTAIWRATQEIVTRDVADMLAHFGLKTER